MLWWISESPFIAAGLTLEIGIIVRDAASAQFDFTAFGRLTEIRAGIAADNPHAGLLAAFWTFISSRVHIFYDSHRT